PRPPGHAPSDLRSAALTPQQDTSAKKASRRARHSARRALTAVPEPDPGTSHTSTRSGAASRTKSARRGSSGSRSAATSSTGAAPSAVTPDRSDGGAEADAISSVTTNRVVSSGTRVNPKAPDRV